MDSASNKILRCDLDGTNVETIVSTGLSSPCDVAVDDLGMRIYWTDRGVHAHGGGHIASANPDGTDIRVIVDSLSSPAGIAVDADMSKVYWAEQHRGIVRRANLDGSSIELICKEAEYADGVAIDLTNYVTDDLIAPFGVAVDSARQVLYTTDNMNKIVRTDLRELSNDILLDDVDLPRGLDLDVGEKQVYWADRNRVRCANMDGSGIHDLVVGDRRSFYMDVVVDRVRGRIYWSDIGNKQIYSAQLDGSDVREVLQSSAGRAIGGWVVLGGTGFVIACLLALRQFRRRRQRPVGAPSHEL